MNKPTMKRQLLDVGKQVRRKLKVKPIGSFGKFKLALSQYRTRKELARKAARKLGDPRTPKAERPFLANTLGNRRKPALLIYYSK